MKQFSYLLQVHILHLDDVVDLRYIQYDLRLHLQAVVLLSSRLLG